MKKSFPRVLICAPTAASKNYCFEKWIDNVMSFTYPEFTVRLFDNTSDKGVNAKRLNDKVASRYGNVGANNKFYAANSLLLNNSQDKDITAKLALPHNDCRNLFLAGGYDYMLHLESDVFPQTNIIETLMFHRKQVVGALYYRDSGAYRSIMLQKMIYLAPREGISVNFTAGEELYFIDGTLKQASSVGLGCVLIAKPVLQSIKFRRTKGSEAAPDAYFSEDCFTRNIKIYADTSCIAVHDNQDWGIYGIDFK